MAVPEQTPYKEYVGNGVTTNFALGFACDLKQELKVFINNIEPELSTWSLTGGSVSFTTAPSSGSKIVLKRATKLERTTNYLSSNNSFRPEAINKDLDRVWYALQDQAYKLGQYDLDYSYAINTSNQALSDAATAQQRADDAYDLADTTNTEIRSIERGGTGASTVVGARNNLNVYSQAEVDALVATGGQGNIVGVSGGGTGASTAAGARTNLGVMSSSEVTAAIANATPTLPDATESTAGKAKIATTAIAQAGTNDTDIITAKKLRDVAGNAIKPRSWSNVTASRIADTWYTNTTGNDIGVYVARAGANINPYITIRKTGTSTELILSGTGVGNNLVALTTGFWEVPDGFDYKISPFGTVMELRV